MEKLSSQIRENKLMENPNPNDFSKQKYLNHDFEFYITRYPFPHSSIALQAKFYMTFYECESLQEETYKKVRLTSLNRLSSLIKLRKIGKNGVKQKGQNSKQDNPNVTIYSYSLYYQIIPHFILSSVGISIIMSLISPNEYRKLFHGIAEDIEALIFQKISYIIDIQNIGITVAGQVKIYVPANNILEEFQFTEKNQIEMRNTFNATVECIIRNLQNYTGQKSNIDVQNIRNQIKQQLQKVEIKPKNIQSQIFTFNQNIQSITDKQRTLAEYNEDLQKTVKIRKSSQKIQFVPIIDFNLIKHNMSKDASKHHARCVTSRDFLHKDQDGSHTNRQGQKKHVQAQKCEIIYENPHKQNQFLKERMKDYQQKLQNLNNTVKMMKQQLLTMSKKQKKVQKQVLKDAQNDRQRSRTLTNLSEVNQSRYEDISCMADKLSSSRIQIKKLLHDDTFLRKSYHVEEESNQDDEDDPILKKQIQQLLGSNQEEIIQKQKIASKNKKQTRKNEVSNKKPTNKQNNNVNNDNQKSLQKQRVSNLKGLKENSNFDFKDDSNPKSRTNRKSPNSYDYESSLGKYSPPGGNPFRQYGNFRIEYVNGEDDNSNKQSQQQNQHAGGRIQIHPEPIVQPYKIVRAPIKKEHFFYPVVHIREPFRYSCLAIPKDSNAEYEYIAISENMYDPTEYDSIDTFQMELGKQYKMPTIVSKDAYRHTLFPSTIVERKRPVTKPNEKRKEKQSSLSGSVRKLPRQNRIYESAGSTTFKKFIQPFMGKDYHEPCLRDNLSEKKSSKKLPKIREAPEAFHQVSMQVQNQSFWDQMKQDKKDEQFSRSKQKFEFYKYPTVQKPNQNIQRLSRTIKDVTKLFKKDLSEQKNSKRQYKVAISRGKLNLQKKKVDKQKLNAILNKSKEIISKYKNFGHKKE